jgi:major membrane immunogen (membrane-anchored lipoprotein)
LQGVEKAEAIARLDQERQRTEQLDAQTQLREQKKLRDDFKHKEEIRKQDRQQKEEEALLRSSDLNVNVSSTKNTSDSLPSSPSNHSGALTAPSSRLPSPPSHHLHPLDSSQVFDSHETHVPHHHLHVFKATYDWQSVPIGAWVDPRLEQEIRNGTRRAKIPTTWETVVDVLVVPPTSNKSNKSVSGTVTTTVTVEVERHMRLRDLSSAITLAIEHQGIAEKGKSDIQVRVQSNGVSFNEYADMTVEALGSDFYHARPEAEVIGGSMSGTPLSPTKPNDLDLGHEESGNKASLSAMSSLSSPLSTRGVKSNVASPSSSTSAHNMNKHGSPVAVGGGGDNTSTSRLHSPCGTNQATANNETPHAETVGIVGSEVEDTKISDTIARDEEKDSRMAQDDEMDEMHQYSLEYQRRIQAVRNICMLFELLHHPDRLRELRASSNGSVGRSPSEDHVADLANMALLLSLSADKVVDNTDQLMHSARSSQVDVVCVATHRAFQHLSNSILTEALHADDIYNDGDSELVQLLNKNPAQVVSSAGQAQHVMQVLERSCLPPECASLVQHMVEHCRILVRNRVVSLNTASATYAELILTPPELDDEEDEGDQPPPTRVLASAIRYLADPDAQLVLQTMSSTLGGSGDMDALANGQHSGSESSDESDDGGARRGEVKLSLSRRLSFDPTLSDLPADVAATVTSESVGATASKESRIEGGIGDGGGIGDRGGGDKASRVSSLLRRISLAGGDSDDDDGSSLGSGTRFYGGGRAGGMNNAKADDLEDDDDDESDNDF